jgi:hypothetical protein
MAITVYWSMMEDQWIRAKEPVSIQKRFFEMHPPQKSGTNFCPSIKHSLKNLYGLQSIYDYEFYIQDKELYTKMYDEDFFTNHVIIRDMDQKFFSFTQKFIFFADQEIEMTAYLPPFLEQNEVVKRTYSITGKFNIGKWFRIIEFPFFLRDGYDTFTINSDDIYTYIQFHTEEKIVFKKFCPTDKIKHLSESSLASSEGIKWGKRGLQDYYRYFTYKNVLLNEIKSNLVEG